jgi:hypothetical protein
MLIALTCHGATFFADRYVKQSLIIVLFHPIFPPLIQHSSIILIVMLDSNGRGVIVDLVFANDTHGAPGCVSHCIAKEHRFPPELRWGEWLLWTSMWGCANRRLNVC